MINKQSIDRSIELTKSAQDFYAYKKQYYKTQQAEKEKIIKNKEKLLSYFHATYKDWDDWHWQQSHRISSTHQLKEIFNCSDKLCQNIDVVSELYRWIVTPYYLSNVTFFDVTDPIYLQIIPTMAELLSQGESDPMNENNTNPAGAIVRRYPDRVVLKLTNQCAAFCRHCQRKRNFGDKDSCISQRILDESINYIYKHPEIRDVLLTGGDPLTLPNNYIDEIIKRIRSIKSVEIIRIGTRVLATMPQRIDENLIKILKKYAPLYINTQFNHPNEITYDSERACNLLAENGIVLGNQMVFLKGVNNNYYTVALLNELLLKNRIRPYYIFHPKNVKGTSHFYITLTEGINIYDRLRGNISGLAIPAYIYNAPNGFGKIALNKQLLCLQSNENTIQLTSWEGKNIEIILK